MMTSGEEVKGWIKRGNKKGAAYIVSVCDTFNYESYPVFVMPGEDPEKVRMKFNAKEMQRVNEIIPLEASQTVELKPLEAPQTVELKLETNRAKQMTAKNARALTEANILSKTNGLISEINSKIERAIAAKQFKISIDAPAAQEEVLIKKYYVDLFYGWERNNANPCDRFCSGATITISW